MRAWVGTPQMEEAVGGKMMVANRNDGYSVMMPVLGRTPEQMRSQLDTYLNEECTCDSSSPGKTCFVHHRQVMVA